MEMEERFRNRTEAGRRLADALPGLAGQDAVVLALPRGGVPVAAEIARRYGLPLDLALVRKVGMPQHEEFAVAAIAGPEGAEMVINAPAARRAGLDEAAIGRLAEPERAELRRRRHAYLGDRPPVPLAGRTAVLVDDGVATGATMRAAIRAVRREGPAHVLLAVPVASPEALAALRPEVDGITCLLVPADFQAVGLHYDDFRQVADAEVTASLALFPPAPEAG
jgi:putative phosphoribosyl transferase